MNHAHRGTSSAASSSKPSVLEGGRLPPGHGEEPTRVRYGVIAFTVTMAVLLYLHRFAITPASTTLQDELGLNKEDLGNLQAAFFYVYALCQVPSGWLSDRFRARLTLTIYMAGWSLAMIGMGLAAGFWSFLVFRMLLGACQAGAYPTAAGLLKHWIPLRRRGLANALVSMSGRAGYLLTLFITVPLMLVVGSAVGIATGQWRVVFGGYGLLGLAWAVLFVWRYRNTPAEHPRCNDAERGFIGAGAETADSQPVASHALPWRAILRSRSVWGMCLINFFLNIAWVFLATFLPDYLETVHGVPRAWAGPATALTALAGMMGCFCGGLLTDRLVRRVGVRWGRRLPGMIASLGGALAYAIVIGTGNLYVLVALFALISLTVDLGVAAGWSVYQDIGGRNVAVILGIANMCGNLAAGMFSSRIGHFADQGQWNTVFLISMTSFIAIALCWLLVDASRKLTDT